MGLDIEAVVFGRLLEIKPVPDLLLRVACFIRHLAATVAVLVSLRLALGLDSLNALILERNFAFLERRLPEQHPRLLRVQMMDIFAHIRNIDRDFVEAEVHVGRLRLLTLLMPLVSLVTRGLEELVMEVQLELTTLSHCHCSHELETEQDHLGNDNPRADHARYYRFYSSIFLLQN